MARPHDGRSELTRSECASIESSQYLGESSQYLDEDTAARLQHARAALQARKAALGAEVSMRDVLAEARSN